MANMLCPWLSLITTWCASWKRIFAIGEEFPDLTAELDRDQGDEEDSEHKTDRPGIGAPAFQALDGLQESQIDQRHDRGRVVIQESVKGSEREQTAREQQNTHALLWRLEWVRPDESRNEQRVKTEEEAVHGGELD